MKKWHEKTLSEKISQVKAESAMAGTALAHYDDKDPDISADKVIEYYRELHRHVPFLFSVIEGLQNGNN